MRAGSWRAVAALPFNVLIVIPALILWWTAGNVDWGWRLSSFGDVTLWFALPLFGVGVALMSATIPRFDEEGGGSLAPWDPTTRLVISGPYRYVRNPMISGVLFNLAGEALLFSSLALAVWFVAFFLTNAVYIPFFEEPGLVERFGEDYRRYQREVPRWIPRYPPL